MPCIPTCHQQHLAWKCCMPLEDASTQSLFNTPNNRHNQDPNCTPRLVTVPAGQTPTISINGSSSSSSGEVMKMPALRQCMFAACPATAITTTVASKQHTGSTWLHAPAAAAVTAACPGPLQVPCHSCCGCWMFHGWSISCEQLACLCLALASRCNAYHTSVCPKFTMPRLVVSARLHASRVQDSKHQEGVNRRVVKDC